MRAIVAGTESGPIERALAEASVEVTVISDVPTPETLEDAGIDEADVLLLTDASLATTIPVALECNPDIRTIVYDETTVPAFVRGQLDLAVDPQLVDPDTLASVVLPEEEN